MNEETPMIASARCACSLAVLLAVLGSCPAADEGLSRVQLARLGKAATALVEVKAGGGYAYGSAFCVHPAGLFLTDEHVVQGNVTLVLNPGLKGEKAYPARVLRSDPELDLALLRIEGAPPLSALPFGSDETLEELMDVVAFGFPFGKELAPARREYPAISVNAGSITALRRKRGELYRIQLDAALNPGNSGGPVLDRSGKLVGVVVASVRGGSGVNFAIPVSAVARFVARPYVRFEPPPLGSDNASRPVLFEAQVTPLLPPAGPLTVELILQPSRGREQVHRMRADGNSYRVTAVPLPPPSGPGTLRLRAHFADHLLDATTGDRAFRVGDREVQLREVRSIRPGPGSRVLLHGGATIEGVVSGLDAVPVRLGKELRPVSLAQAAEVQVAPAAGSDLLWYTLRGRQGDKELFRQWGNVVLPGLLPDLGAPANRAVRPQPSALVEVKLPSALADVAVGGAGHYLVLHLPRERQLTVFDVDAGAIAGRIPVPEDNARFAAGLEDVIVLLPGAGTIERWSLKTQERVGSAPLPIKRTIKAVAMGSASKGPLLVHWAMGTTPLDRASFALLDGETFRVVEGEIPMHGSLGAFFGDAVHLRASANGRVFGLWSTSHTPSGMGTIVASEDATLWYYAHDSAGYVLPGPDGKSVFTRSGRYPLASWLDFAFVAGDGKLRFVRRNVPRLTDGQRRGSPVLPACQGNVYLTLPQGDQGAPTVRAPGKDTPIATLPDLELPPPGEERLPHDLTFDKRVYLIPGARLIITIPASNDRLVLHRLGPSDPGLPEAEEEGVARIFTYIDLQPKANQKLKGQEGDHGNNLAALPTGEQTFARVPFQVGPAAIQLGNPPFNKVEGIRVGRRFTRLHFLHATHQGTADAALIGQYTVTWDDGTSATIPVRYGKDVLDWWSGPDARGPAEGKVAWQGDNDEVKRYGKRIRLYLTTWENPKPDREVKAIAFARAEGTPCLPFCVAMTAEGKD
jgi:hypothetical protein